MTASPQQEIRALQEIQGSDDDPEGRAFVHLADARRRNGELDEALEILEEGLERHPEFSSAHVVSGWIHRDRGESDEAESAFRRVLELDEENTAALRGLGELSAARDSVDAAVGWFKRLAALVPEDRELADRIDDLERELLAREAEAFSELDGIMSGEGAAEGDPEEFVRMDSVGDASDLGDILSMGDEPEEPAAEHEPAFESEEPALEADEPEEEESAAEDDEPPAAEDEAEWEPEEGVDEKVFTETMGELYVRQGLLDRAVEVFEHLVEERPDEARLRERLAELREKAAEGPVAAPPADGGWFGTAAEGDEAVETLAREMSSGEGAAGALDTPFAWEEDEAEVGAAGPDDDSGGPITGYFGRLLGWEPEGESGLPEPASGEAAPATGAGAEVVPIESLAPDDESQVGGAPDVVPVGSLAPDDAAPAPTLTLDDDEEEGSEPVVMIAASSGDAVPIESLAPDAGSPVGGASGAVPIESLAPDPAPPAGGAPEGGGGAEDGDAGDGDEDFGRWLDRLK